MNLTNARHLFYNNSTLLVLFVLYIAFSSFSAWMVYNGLHLSGNFSAMWSWALACLALMLQAVVIISLLLIPDMFSHKSWAKKISALGIVVIIVAIVLFEIFHSMMSQINAGQGEDMRAVEIQELQTLNNRNTALTAKISSVFTTRRNEFATQREQARQGHDSSGVAKFGEIARAYQRHFDNTSNYLDLTTTIDEPSNSDDPRILFNDVDARFKQSTAQLKRLEQFENSVAALNASLSANDEKLRLETANIQAIVPASITAEHAALAQDIESKQSNYQAMHQITDTELAMKEAFALLNKLWQLQFQLINGHSILAIVYSIFPFLCTVILGILFRFVNEQIHNDDDLEQINNQTAQLHEKTQSYEALAAAEQKASIAKAIAKSSKKIFQNLQVGV